MDQEILESTDFIGYCKLLEVAELASKRLGMEFSKTSRIHQGIKYEIGIISDKDTEYETRTREENKENVGGHYLYNHLLYKMKGEGKNLPRLVLESRDYASWNRFDETIEADKFTNLYLEDKLGKEIFKILNE